MNIRSIVEEEVDEGESGQLDLEDDMETMIKHHRKAILTQHPPLGEYLARVYRKIA